jgi:hypothetical protein
MSKFDNVEQWNINYDQQHGYLLSKVKRGDFVLTGDYEELLAVYKSLLSEYRQVYNGTKLMDKNL